MRAERMAGEATVKNPIRGTLVGCCALADEQSAKSRAPSKIANLRLRNADLKLISKESIKPRSMVVPLNPQFEIRNPKSFDHFIRSRQHLLRNREADLLSCF